MVTIIVVIFGLILLGFWLTQLVDLMWRHDEEFPGRFDKLIWGLVLVFGWIVGAIAFWFWKTQAKTDRKITSLVGQHLGGGAQKSKDKPDKREEAS